MVTDAEYWELATRALIRIVSDRASDLSRECNDTDSELLVGQFQALCDIERRLNAVHVELTIALDRMHNGRCDATLGLFTGKTDAECEGGQPVIECSTPSVCFTDEGAYIPMTGTQRANLKLATGVTDE